jgi:hypothetical protein
MDYCLKLLLPPTISLVAGTSAARGDVNGIRVIAGNATVPNGQPGIRYRVAHRS